MLEYLFGRRNRKQSREILQRCLPVAWESLENRQLLSASMGPSPDHRGPGGPGGPPPAGPEAAIEFSQTTTAVQTGLTSLAATDVVTAPSATSTIHLANVNGIETYTYETNSTGTDDKLTVDQNGNPVTPPTHTNTSFGDITNTAVTNEINAIANALDLTAPTSTTNVFVLTAADGSAVYSISLTSADDATTTTTTADTDNDHPHNALISVDSNGNPVGHERVPLSVLSTVVQTGLTSNAPAAATPLDLTSLIDVNTVQGATLYTAHYTSTGTQTSVTVNQAGTLTSLPSTVQTTFSDLPPAAQNELQALATADGFTGTIDATLSVTESIEVNGTIVYTIHLPLASDDTTSDSSDDDDSYSHDMVLTLSVDAFGNPTVPPGFGPTPGVHDQRPHADPGDDDSDDNSSSTTGDDDSTNSGSNCDKSSNGSGSDSSTSSSGSSDSSSAGSTALPSAGGSSTTASTAATVAAFTPTTTTTTTMTKAQLRAAAKTAKAQAKAAAKLAKAQAKAAAKAAKLAAANG